MWSFKQTDGCQAYSHTQQASTVMLQCKILIMKFCVVVNRTGACAITIDKVSPLYHEILDLYPPTIRHNP